MNQSRNARIKRICPTLDQALTRYLSGVTIHKKSAESEKSVINAWRATRLISRRLTRITPFDLAELRDEWLVIYEPGTVVRRLALISHLYTTAAKEWKMDWLHNPVKKCAVRR